MPVTLPEDTWEAWIMGGAGVAQAMMENPRKVPWAWHKVSTAVNTVKNDSPTLLEEYVEPQGSLL